MKIILPVAGKGTRLRPHTHSKAKSLVQVAGKTVLEHIIERLLVVDNPEFIFIIDENGNQIADFMGQKFPQFDCQYVVQHERLGPAHAVMLAGPHIKKGDDVLVVFNDTIFVTDLGQIPELTANCDGLIYSKEVEDYQRFGVNVIDSDGYISDMVEKPDQPISNLAQVGLYYLKDGRAFIEAIEATVDAGDTVKGEYYLPSVFMRMIKGGSHFTAPTIDAWLDCGKPETLLETNRYLLKESHYIGGEVINSVIIEPVFIAKGAVVKESIIGPNVAVAEGGLVDRSILSDSIVNKDAIVIGASLNNSLLGDSSKFSGPVRKISIGDHSVIDLIE